MRIIKDVTALYQGSATAINPNFYTGQALGIRIVPNYTVGTTGNLFPRGLIVEDAITNQAVDLADTSWFIIQRQILQNAYFGNLEGVMQGTDNPLSHTVGPSVKIRFNVDQVGANQSDSWDVYIAEDLVDVLTPIAPSGVSLIRDPASGLYYAVQAVGGGVASVQITNSINVNAIDQQVSDTTAVASTPLSVPIAGTVFRDYLVRITGLSAPTTRSLTILGVRTDASTFPLFIPAAFGATITDAIIALGLGSNLPATPTGATSVGLNFSSPMPISFQINLASGTDTPRVTVWGRQNS